MDIEKRIEKLNSIVEETIKAIQLLMIANGAALAASLTLLKDYDTTAKYKGIGTFITLFGSGFIAALAAFVWASHLRLNMYDLMFQRPLKEKRSNWSLWLAGLFAGASMIMLMTAVFLIIARFKSL
jgi:hypothetical protein